MIVDFVVMCLLNQNFLILKFLMTSDVIHFKFSNTLSWTNLNVRIMEEKWQQHREASNKVTPWRKRMISKQYLEKEMQVQLEEYGGISRRQELDGESGLWSVTCGLNEVKLGLHHCYIVYSSRSTDRSGRSSNV